MAERLTNYTIGESTELPSGGQIYSVQMPRLVELRSMTARDEMKRLSPSTTQFKNLADIIEGCLIEKLPVHVYDLACGDYEYLLHKLRVVTYGKEYLMSVRCPHCGQSFDASADLESLEVKEFDVDTFNNLRTFVLPKSNHTVTIKFQTPRMLDEIEMREKELKRKYKDATVDLGLLVFLSTVIESVDGMKLDPVRMESFINTLPALDTIKIVNTVDKLNNMVGVDSLIHVTCSKCGGEVPTYFRFGPEFFRPTNI